MKKRLSPVVVLFPTGSMDAAFGSHLDQLIEHLKTQVLQHYERDLATWKGRHVPAVADNEAFSVTGPHILGLQRKSPNEGMHLLRSPQMLMNRKTAPDSDSDDEPEPRTSTISTAQPRLASKTAMSEDSEMSQGTADSVELKTPQPVSRAPRFPKPEGVHPFSPHTPQMPPTQLIPVMDAAAIPHAPEPAEEEETKVDEQAKVTKVASIKSEASSISRSNSSASFSSTSTPNDEMPTHPMPNRCKEKRVSNASFSEFFKRQATVTDLYLFMQDEDSSKAAWMYAKFMNYFMTAAIVFTVWQANAQPVVPRFFEGVVQIAVEGLLLLELLAHFFSTRSGERRAFLRNPYLSS